MDLFLDIFIILDFYPDLLIIFLNKGGFPRDLLISTCFQGTLSFSPLSFLIWYLTDHSYPKTTFLVCLCFSKTNIMKRCSHFSYLIWQNATVLSFKDSHLYFTNKKTEKRINFSGGFHVVSGAVIWISLTPKSTFSSPISQTVHPVCSKVSISNTTCGLLKALELWACGFVLFF